MGWFRKINKNGEDYKPIGNVITATSLSVSGPDLADGDVVRVMFTTDIAGSDTSTPLALTWNGGATPIPVKASKGGSLASVYAHEVATNIFKYISGYVTLEMMFDGTNLVIIGNPVVLSGSDYTIYADGYKEETTSAFIELTPTAGGGFNTRKVYIAKRNGICTITYNCSGTITSDAYGNSSFTLVSGVPKPRNYTSTGYLSEVNGYGRYSISIASNSDVINVVFYAMAPNIAATVWVMFTLTYFYE